VVDQKDEKVIILTRNEAPNDESHIDQIQSCMRYCRTFGHQVVCILCNNGPSADNDHERQALELLLSVAEQLDGVIDVVAIQPEIISPWTDSYHIIRHQLNDRRIMVYFVYSYEDRFELPTTEVSDNE